MNNELLLCVEQELSRYGFPDDHAFSSQRLFAFLDELDRRVPRARYGRLPCRVASEEQLRLFHHPDYIGRVKQCSLEGCGFLDQTDTPVFPGVYEAASRVVGTVLAGVERIMDEETRRVFIPIAGLHHAQRKEAAGFCVFNDIAIAIESLRGNYGIRKIAYIDIDAHHGDGVFYAYESDPELLIADFHEDGHFLYPGTGHAHETGKGAASGTKMNLPLPMNADDEEFLELWPKVERFIDDFEPEFLLLQAGADSMKGDPLTDMELTTRPYATVAERLRSLAERHCEGRLLVMGGGGYKLENLAAAWVTLVEHLL